MDVIETNMLIEIQPRYVFSDLVHVTVFCHGQLVHLLQQKMQQINYIFAKPFTFKAEGRLVAKILNHNPLSRQPQGTAKTGMTMTKALEEP